MKRGQMEMAGLVIIVILITLGMLFALLFFVKKGPEEKQIFVRKGLAYSTLGAMLRTSVPCHAGDTTHVKMVDLLEDCARLDQFQGGTLYQCREIERMEDLPNREKTICTYTQQEMKTLLDPTLTAWQRDYRLTVELLSVGGPVDPPLITLGVDQCPGEQDSSGVFPEQTEVGILQSQLVICG